MKKKNFSHDYKMSAGKTFVESSILAALFQCTTEQSAFFNKEFKRRDAVDFGKWKDDGYRVMNLMEKQLDKSNMYVDEIKYFIHNAIYEFKTNLYRQMVEKMPEVFTETDIRNIHAEYDRLIKRIADDSSIGIQEDGSEVLKISIDDERGAEANNG